MSVLGCLVAAHAVTAMQFEWPAARPPHARRNAHRCRAAPLRRHQPPVVTPTSTEADAHIVSVPRFLCEKHQPKSSADTESLAPKNRTAKDSILTEPGEVRKRRKRQIIIISFFRAIRANRREKSFRFDRRKKRGKIGASETK